MNTTNLTTTVNPPMNSSASSSFSFKTIISIMNIILPIMTTTTMVIGEPTDELVGLLLGQLHPSALDKNSSKLLRVNVSTGENNQWARNMDKVKFSKCGQDDI